MTACRQRKKVRVLTRCVADTYTRPYQKVIEFCGTHPDQGGLVSFILTPDGRMIVDVYRQGKAVEVRVGKPDDF